MTVQRILIILAFVVVLTLPFMVPPAGGKRASTARPTGDAQSLIVVTPHVGQLRDEFSDGFQRWYSRKYPSQPKVFIDWRVPGGTTEILKQLKAEYESAAKSLAASGELKGSAWSADQSACDAVLPAKSMGADLLFGGGHYDHDQLRTGVTLKLMVDGKERSVTVRLSEPAGFPKEKLVGEKDSWFTSARVGNQDIFEKDQYWIGAALSSFGIVYNKELIAERGLSSPTTFADLCDPAYFGTLALADPRQSGSVNTTYESILNREGWDTGWGILRKMGANARSFASASTKPPVDVSQGDALAGLAIDFYGRAQAQAVVPPGEPSDAGRVGYVDPRGAVYIDADPVSVLRGCPHPELARQFIEFCLTEEGQAIWQMPPVSSEAGKRNPKTDDGVQMGPRQYALRRLPCRQVMYEKYMDAFVDKVNPFELAASLPDRRWRRAIDTMMGAFAVDTATELRAAWAAIIGADKDPSFPTEVREQMRREFFSFPKGADVERLHARFFAGQPLPADAMLDFSPEVLDKGDAKKNPKGEDNCRRITATWSDAALKTRLRVVYTEYFRETYLHVVELSQRRRLAN